MRLVCEVQGEEYVLTCEQASALVNTLADAKCRVKKYAGVGGGYKSLLGPAPTSVLSFTAMDDVTYEAMVLATKLHNPEQ